MARDVYEHKRITDETEMLRLVMEKFVTTDGIIEFITKYEEHRKEKIYTKRRQLFGQEVTEVKFQEGHLFNNLAKRIKIIRNAIVHSSDKYERHERYIPLTSRMEIIIKEEIPLLRFLAERVIIGTAESDK